MLAARTEQEAQLPQAHSCGLPLKLGQHMGAAIADAGVMPAGNKLVARLRVRGVGVCGGQPAAPQAGAGPEVTACTPGGAAGRHELKTYMLHPRETNKGTTLVHPEDQLHKHTWMM